MVKRVMARLVPVSGMEDVDWEIRVIDDPSERALSTLLPRVCVKLVSARLS